MAPRQYESNAQIQGQALQQNVLDQLGQALKAKAQREAEMQQIQEQAKQKDMLNQQELERNKGLYDYLRSGLKPGESGTIGQGSVTAGRRDPGVAQDRLDIQKQRRLDNLTKSIQSDYESKSKGDRESVGRAKSIADALEKGDITTLGQVKANLPGVEGERYRPTDKERELILQQTSTGQMDKLMNYFGGDKAALSDAQKKAYAELIRHKAGVAEQRLSNTRKEVMQRYKHRISQMAPEEQTDLANSLGMAPTEMAQHLQGKSGSGPSKDEIMKQIQELEARKAQSGGAGQ